MHIWKIGVYKYESYFIRRCKKVGKKGEIVNVSDGYGQNFLIKNCKALMATETGKKIVAQQEEEKKQEDLKKKEEAQELAKKLETIVVEFKVKTGKDGKSLIMFLQNISQRNY